MIFNKRGNFRKITELPLLLMDVRFTSHLLILLHTTSRVNITWPSPFASQKWNCTHSQQTIMTPHSPFMHTFASIIHPVRPPSYPVHLIAHFNLSPIYWSLLWLYAQLTESVAFTAFRFQSESVLYFVNLGRTIVINSYSGKVQLWDNIIVSPLVFFHCRQFRFPELNRNCVS